MANGFNPYDFANVDILSDIVQRESTRKQREGSVQTAIQKSKLVERFNKEQEEAMKKFEEDSKGGFFGKLSKPWLTSLIGLVNPLAASIMSGVGTAGVGIKSRKAAKDLPGMGGWKTTFLSGDAKKTEDYYKGIKESAPSLFENLLSGAISGVTQKVLSEGTKKAFKGDESVKVFGPDKVGEDKFFERVAKKLGEKTVKEYGEKAQKGFFERLKEGVGEDKLLSKDWVKLLQTAPELLEGDITDFITQIQGKQAQFGSWQEIEDAWRAKTISNEEYEELKEEWNQ